MLLKRTITVFPPHSPDSYDVELRGSLITRVVKFIGDDQMQREVDFETLPKSHKDKILSEIAGETTSGDGDSDEEDFN
jgi:hypothetical protein